jgi:hypothetical protein
MASFALAVIVDKLLLIHHFKNSDAYLLALVLFQQIFVILILVSAFIGAGFVYPLSLFGMLAGTAQAAMYASYPKALRLKRHRGLFPSSLLSCRSFWELPFC